MELVVMKITQVKATSFVPDCLRYLKANAYKAKLQPGQEPTLFVVNSTYSLGFYHRNVSHHHNSYLISETFQRNWSAPLEVSCNAACFQATFQPRLCNALCI